MMHIGDVNSNRKPCSVTTSSDGLIFVKRQAKNGRFFSKNAGVRRAKRRAKFKLCIKKARKFDSRHFNNKSAYINTILGESSFGGSFPSTGHLIVSRWRSLVAT